MPVPFATVRDRVENTADPRTPSICRRPAARAVARSTEGSPPTPCSPASEHGEHPRGWPPDGGRGAAGAAAGGTAPARRPRLGWRMILREVGGSQRDRLSFRRRHLSLTDRRAPWLLAERCEGVAVGDLVRWTAERSHQVARLLVHRCGRVRAQLPSPHEVPVTGVRTSHPSPLRLVADVLIRVSRREAVDAGRRIFRTACDGEQRHDHRRSPRAHAANAMPAECCARRRVAAAMQSACW